MNVDPQNPKDPDRTGLCYQKDIVLRVFIQLLLTGVFSPVEDLKGFRQADSYLEGHPNMEMVPGVDMSTGSLGQGISAAVGMALAENLTRKLQGLCSSW